VFGLGRAMHIYIIFKGCTSDFRGVVEWGFFMVVGAFTHLISRPQMIVLLVPFDHKTTQIIRLESDLQAFCFHSCVPESELTVCEAAASLRRGSRVQFPRNQFGLD
jgi:hypothetical protein